MSLPEGHPFMPDMNIAPGRPTEIAPAETPGLHALLFVNVSVVVVAGLYSAARC